ncbi:MAG: ribonuclease J, partial [Epsilonproteobacteria bacterium]|nr:ribonuclease J [Campylobacterota bacterium]
MEEKKTNESTPESTPQSETKESKKVGRDRPDRPRRSRNPHRNPNQKQENRTVVATPEATAETASKPNDNKTNKPNANTNSRKPNPRNNNRNGKRNKNSMGPLSNDIKEALKVNKIANEARMNPWQQIDVSNKNKIRFTPLGGLGEIGGNIAVLEDEESAIIIDVGMSFPDETMHGVDILVPDFSYLHAIKSKIKAIVITHAHEDHIGAVPYLFKELKFPIYGTPLALAMIENKFNEHKLKDDVKYFNYITKREIYDIGTFKVEWMHMTHSIVDACGLAIQTSAGTLLHTADFKIDHTPIDNQTTDLQRFAHYGAKGVLCLFSDSTNSHNPGFTKSEAVVGKTFDTLFDLAKGRVIMSTFSSNTHRIFQAMERGVSAGRKICVIGRSMERNIEIARRLGFVDIADKHFVEAHEVNRFADAEVLVVTTGSQGEEMAALSRMATDEHRHIKLKPTDT